MNRSNTESIFSPPQTTTLFSSVLSTRYTPWAFVPPTATNMASSGVLDSTKTAASAFDGNFPIGAENHTFTQYWQSNSISAPAWLRLDLSIVRHVAGGYVYNWLNPAHLSGFEIWIGDDTNFPGTNRRCYLSSGAGTNYYESFYCGGKGRYLFFARSVPNRQFL